MTQQFTKEDYQAQLDYFNTPSAMRDDSAHGPYDERVIRFALQLAIEHMKRGALDVVPDGWRMTEKQQIVWDWAASHGVTLLADDCNDLLWKLIIVEEK